jgi:hypothetical protein
LQLSSRLAPQRPSDSLGRIGHNLRQDVSVLGGHADLRVAQDLHHNALVNTLGEHEGGGGVPGVMDPHPADTGGFQQGMPFVSVGMGADRPPVGLAPDEVAITPGWSGRHALMELAGPVR